MHQRIFLQICLALLLLAPSTRVLANFIQCTFDVNDSRPQLDIAPTDDIYQSSKINLPDGFRFVGQYLPEMEKFKAYIYHTPKDRYVLFALQEYSTTARTCSQDFGQHRVYNSAYERVLYFHCKKICS